MGDARINFALEAESPHHSLDLTRITAHDRRAAVREDRSANPCFLAPAELKGDRSVPDRDSILLADHRTSDGRAIADVEVDAAKRRRRGGKLGHVRQVKEAVVSRRHAISDGRCADGMPDRKRAERYSVDCRRFSQRHPAPIVNGITMEQLQCFRGGVDRARRASGKARSVIGMRVREHDRGRCHFAKPSGPIRPAVDHDAGIAVPNK